MKIRFQKKLKMKKRYHEENDINKEFTGMLAKELFPFLLKLM